MVRNPGVVNWTLILGTHHWNFPPWQRRPWCVPEPEIFWTRRHPWMFMYPRGEAGQWSEAALNNFQKGLNGFQSSAKLPPVLASGRGIQKRFGIKLQHCLQESHSAKGTFIPILFRAPIWSGWAYMPALREGMWLPWRFCVPPSTHAGYCTWKELLEFLNF